MNAVREFYITRIENGKVEKKADIVVCEYPFSIYFNGIKITTLICSPDNLDYLALGFLISEGIVDDRSNIKDMRIDDKNNAAYIYDYSYKGFQKEPCMSPIKCSSGATIFGETYDCSQYKTDDISIHFEKIFSLMENFISKSKMFQNTGGVHSAALSDTERILIFHEDIGRHNALDKVIGEANIKGIDLYDKLILTSGRISTEMLIKAAKRNVPIFVSHSAPMDLALDLGKKINMTVIGFVRGKRFNVYSGVERIIFNDE